jgi:hypothetical protein
MQDSSPKYRTEKVAADPHLLRGSLGIRTAAFSLPDPAQVYFFNYSDSTGSP